MTIILSPCRVELEKTLPREVDLLNARQVSTVFQKEIIGCGRRIHGADRYAVDEFEMLVISYYQKCEHGITREPVEMFKAMPGDFRR
ncbi:MAG: hypothetical protein FJ121_13125 [Deltaproteobacteria bacterium]|nr:hypothetical protein [Deltaproteobacteria bacterium]